MNEAHAWRKPKEREGVDGSSFYKEAFRLLGQLSDEEQAMLKRPAAEVDPEMAAALFEKLKPIMELLHRGAAADFCDWALAPMPIGSLPPYLTFSQNLASAARWVADYRFPTEPEAAIGDLAARARLGHHISDQSIGFLVNASFEETAIELLLQNAGRLTPDAIDSARALLDGSSLSEDSSRCVVTQIAWLENLRGLAPEDRAKILNDSPVPPEVRVRFGDPAFFQSEIAFAIQVARQVANAISLPAPEYERAVQEMKAAAAGHPIAAGMLLSFDVMNSRATRSMVQREMLKAGLDLLGNGELPADVGLDPTTGLPFIYQAMERGFSLQSPSATPGGQAITMTFPRTGSN